MHNLDGEVQIHDLHSLKVLVRAGGNALVDTDMSEQPLPYVPDIAKEFHIIEDHDVKASKCAHSNNSFCGGQIDYVPEYAFAHVMFINVQLSHAYMYVGQVHRCGDLF